jgi:polysaccharide biosynthesis protein PslG
MARAQTKRLYLRFLRPRLRFGMSLLGICVLLVAGCGQLNQDLVTSPPAQGQAVLFGLTVHDYAHVKPLLAYGTTRTWDAYPGLDWAEANPASGKFNFSPLNSFISINQARGTEMIYTFGRTPLWASTQPNAPGPYGPGQCASPNLAAWDRYVTAIVTNAAGRIKYWELWNEPNDAQFYCGDIPTMVAMAKHAYAIIKSIDPSAKVLSPAVTEASGPSWLASFLSGGGSSSVDIIAFHGYGTDNAEDLNAIVSSYRNVMSTHDLSSLPLWDTEGSWGESAIGDDSHRAAFLAKYYFLQWSQGVARVVWYAYDNNGPWGRLIGTTSDLTGAGLAFRQTYNWTVGATMTRPCAVDSNQTWVCTLTRPGGYQAEIVWNSTKNLNSYPAPAPMSDYRDLSGNFHSIVNGNVPVGNGPILIESSTPSN